MKIKLLAISMAATLLSTPMSLAASVAKAGMLNQHGLTREAKSELIEVVFSNSADSDKAEAYYSLGTIAFEENKISVALDAWRDLVKKYPNSNQAKIVKNRIGELAEIVGESARETVENAVALSYLRHGDFWSQGKNSKFSIDSSWIPNVETAITWYDKIISEFPKSTASRIAYQNKLQTLLGWKEPGRDGDTHGIKSEFGAYMPLLLETFASFEKDHPSESTLQAFRYQIAQAYWNNKDWAKTREWLNLIIKRSGQRESFYKDLAERRLQKVEY